MKKNKYIAVCRSHWTNYWVRGLLILFFLICAITFLSDAEFEEFLVFLAAIVILAASIFISYKSDYLALTETEIVGRRGFIRSKKMSTPISKVQNISIENGLFGKIFKYHKILIDNAGSSAPEYVFNRMAKAQEFVDAYKKVALK